MQPPVVIPSSNLVYNRAHARHRSHSRHGSVSSASERPEVMNGLDISLSDDQNGADAESHRSTLRPPPKPYAVSNQNLIPPSPRGSRKPTEPRNGSPARSNTRAHSPFLSPDRSGPHSPDLRRGRPSPYTTQAQPRAIQPSPERSRTVCDDRPFSGAPGTPPHGRSGSDGAVERERPEAHGDIRMEERTTAKWKAATGTKDLEASKLTREPSWVMVERAQETRLQRVGQHKSSPRYPPSSNSNLSRSHGISHMPRQPHTPGGDREPRGSGRQEVPPAWLVQSKLASGDPSNPVPQYTNLKMAKSVGDLRGDKGAISPLSQGRSRFGPAPPLPSTPSSGNPSQLRDVTPTSQTMNGDSTGSSSQREVISSANDPSKPQGEPSRPFLRTSPTNSRPIRPLPQQTPVQPAPDVTLTATLSQPRLPFPQSPPSGLSTPTSSTSTLLPTQSDPISRPRSVLDEESMPPPAPPPHAPRLQRLIDSSVFSEPLQESDMLRSPLPLPQPPRFPPRQLPPPLSREDSTPVTATRALPIPCRTPAMDDRSADARSGSLIDITSTPANRTPPRSPVSPRSPWTDTRERFGPRPDVAAANAMSSADVPWCHGQGRDLIDFNRPPEQTIMQDDNTLRAIRHLLDGQSSSDEATVTMKPKSVVLPTIPPPPPLQAIRNIGYVPPPPPLPKPPIPVTPTQSNNSIYSSTPLTPDSQPSDQDGSDSEAGTLWQKPMIEEESLAERPKSASRGPPLTVKIDGQFGGPPPQVSQTKSSSSSGGTTLIPNNFPPPPKHPPPSPPLPHWGGRTPTTRQLQRQSKYEGTFQDSSWASRPNPEEVLDRLEDFFPDHDLDKPVIEASSGGTSPTAAENPPAPLPFNGKPTPDKRSRHKKSIRVVAEEHNLRQDRTLRLQSSSAANVSRKRSTKLWDSRVEEVTPGQITSGMPTIPDSPSASGPGTPTPKRSSPFHPGSC
jgi:mitogen-activated protein kinase kinase kinase